MSVLQKNYNGSVLVGKNATRGDKTRLTDLLCQESIFNISQRDVSKKKKDKSKNCTED